MFSPTSTSGRIHESGRTVAEGSWWPCWGDFSCDFRLLSEQTDWHEGYIRGSTAAEALQDLYIATEQQWCCQGSAARPPNEAATGSRAAANKAKPRRWAVLSRVFRPHAPAIYTSGRHSSLRSGARDERRHSGRARVISSSWCRCISWSGLVEEACGKWAHV